MSGRWALRACGLAMLCAVAGPTAACTSDEQPDSPSVPVGQPFAAEQVLSEPGAERRQAHFVTWLPGGRLNLTLELGTRTRWQGHDVSAPPGTVLARLRWSPERDERPGTPWPGLAATDPTQPSSRLVLDAGGRRFVVVSALRSWDADAQAVIALPSRPGDPVPRVVLESGGRRFDAEPGPSRRTTTSVARTTRAVDGVEMRLRTSFDVRRSPFVAGLGWAPQGRVWVVLSRVDVDWDGELRDSGAGLPGLTPRRLSTTVVSSDGRRPARAAGRDVGGTSRASAAARAWSVPSGSTARLVVRVRGEASAASGGGSTSTTALGTEEVVEVGRSEGG